MLKHKQYEYQEFTYESLKTEKFDVLGFINDKGLDGWRLYSHSKGDEPSGIQAHTGQVVLKTVFSGMFYREKPDEDET